MEFRKVIKIRNSLYLCLPATMCEMLALEKGDTFKVEYLEGYGLLVTKVYGDEEVPIGIERLTSMKHIADNIVAEVRRRIRSLYAQFSFNFMSRMLSDLIKGGVLKIDYHQAMAEAGKLQIPDMREFKTGNNPGKAVKKSKKGSLKIEKKGAVIRKTQAG